MWEGERRGGGGKGAGREAKAPLRAQAVRTQGVCPWVLSAR